MMHREDHLPSVHSTPDKTSTFGTTQTMETIMDFPTEHPETPEQSPSGAVPGVARSKSYPARAGTMVWGAVILATAVLIIISSQLNIALDPGLTAMWLLLGAGVVMVAAGAVNLLSKSRR